MSRRARTYAAATAAKRIALEHHAEVEFNPDRCPECDGAGFVEWDRFTGREWPCPVCMATEGEEEVAA